MSSSDNDDDLPPGAIAPIPASGSANGNSIAAAAESPSHDYDDASAETEEEDEILNGLDMELSASSSAAAATVGGLTQQQWKDLKDGNKALFNHAQVLQEKIANSGAAKDQEIIRLQEEITNMRASAAAKDQEIKRLNSLVVEAKDETLKAYQETLQACKESLKTNKETSDTIIIEMEKKMSALELELIELKTKSLTEDPGTQAEVTQSRNRNRSCSSL